MKPSVFLLLILIATGCKSLNKQHLKEDGLTSRDTAAIGAEAVYNENFPETEIPLNNYYINQGFEFYRSMHENSFSETSYWNEKQYQNDFENSFNADEYPDIEINNITKKEFLQARKRTVPLFEANKAIQKKNGIITIGKEQFKDEINSPYQNIYDYLGEYKALNAYVLMYMCSECEEYSYLVVDKKSGNTIGSFENFPHYSPDKKMILCMGQLFEDSPTIVEVYKTPYTPYSRKEFGSWIPVGDSFWGTDGNFYTQAIPYVTASTYYEEKEKRDKEQYNFRYLKIKIKGPTKPKSEE